MNIEEAEAASGTELQQPAIATTKNIKIQSFLLHLSVIKDPVHQSSSKRGEDGPVCEGPSRGIVETRKKK